MFLFILEHPSNVMGNPPTSIHCMVLGSCLKVLPGTPTRGQNEQLHWTQYWRVKNFGCCEAIFYAECYCREMRDGWPHPLWIVNSWVFYLQAQCYIWWYLHVGQANWWDSLWRRCGCWSKVWRRGKEWKLVFLTLLLSLSLLGCQV